VSGIHSSASGSARAGGRAEAEGGEPAGVRSEHRLGRLTRPEALRRIDAGAVVLIPAGSLEQHGAHLPLATDTLLAEWVCLRAAERAAGHALLVAPPLPFGFSPHHVRFGGTVSLTAETYVRVAAEVVRAVRAWAPRVIVVNGHGGNRGPLLTVALESGCPLVSYWELAAASVASLFPADASIGHAGEAETGMMLAAFAGLVGEPAAAFEPPRADAELLLPDLGGSGVIGDPTAAGAPAGAAFLDAVVAELLRRIDNLFSPQLEGT
jgi:creatinine amidohydrolase